MKKLMVLGIAAIAASQLFAIQGTIATDGAPLTGDIKWQARQKSYLISYKKGKTDVSAEYPLSDVTQLDIAKPAGFDKAVEQVRGGQGAAAISALSKIVADYRMLVWDKPAGRYLAFAYLAAGQAQKALDACKAIIDEDKNAAFSGQLAPAYWQALLKTGKQPQLETCLKKAATSGDRAAACAAAAMRGDIIVAGGENSANYRQALAEGYLKATLMFPDPECAQERSDAMLKAADCFDKLNQASRAEKLRNQAKTL